MIDVVVENRQHDLDVDVEHLASLLGSTLRDQGVGGPAEVGLAFVDVDEMTELNRTFMQGTGPTDVLAFPIDGSGEVPSGQPALLGDIVVCPAVASTAPQELADELALLTVHGGLHLLGHDHAEPHEASRMKQLEQDMLQRHHCGR